MSLASIPDALEALRAGRPVIVADDENRENEGDVILSAELATPEWVAWTVRWSSGFICAPMPADWADRLDAASLAGELAYYSGAIKRELHKPTWLLVTHMFNHQTHHRGQVHCMLTQAGGKPGDTDLPFLPT